jgi:hypothetical protein
MQFKRAVQLSLRVAMLSAVFGAGVRADTWDKKTIVTFSESVEIPGQVLPAGTYVFKLANRTFAVADIFRLFCPYFYC